MNIAIISGSARPHSMSLRVSLYLKKILLKHVSCVFLLDLEKTLMHLFDKYSSKESLFDHDDWKSISNTLNQCRGAIIVTPEWNGMLPPVLNYFFHQCTSHELYHKPALLVSISSGVGGTYPIAALRISSYKNTRICYIPEQIIIRNVNTFVEMIESDKLDANSNALAKRIHYAIRVLILYCRSFVLLHNDPLLKSLSYPYGM